MKIVENNFIPFKGFKAINLFGILFVRKPNIINSIDLNHERIHTELMKELLYVFFYIIYSIEWLINLIKCRNSKLAYYNISFEKEAYTHLGHFNYLNERKHYAQWRKI